MAATLHYSALFALLHTNKAPSAAEAQTLRALLSNVQLEADALDANCKNFESVLNNMRTLLHAKRDEESRIHGVLNRFTSKLPPELLGEIFLRATAVGFVDSALAISQTCRWWRTIALATPRMWNVWYLDGKHQVNKDQVAAILARTMDLGLDVTIKGGQYAEIALAALVAVPGFIPNLASLHATLGISLFWTKKFQSGFPVLPALRSVDLVLPPHCVTDVERLLNMLADQPAIRYLKVVAPNIENLDVINNLALPWERLESLELEASIEVRVVHDILLSGTALRTCTIRGVYDRPNAYPHLNNTIRPAVATLPNLETLVLHGFRLSYPLHDHLVLPALTTFDTAGFHRNGLAYLRGLLERSGCSLKTLRLQSQDHPHSLLELLEQSPEIEELVMQESPPGIVFARMVENEDLLPNLTRFKFREVHWTTGSSVEDGYRGLVEMLEARCRVLPGATCRRLASVELQLKGERLADELEAVLGELVEDELVKDVGRREETRPNRRRPILGREVS